MLLVMVRTARCPAQALSVSRKINSVVIRCCPAVVARWMCPPLQQWQAILQLKDGFISTLLLARCKIGLGRITTPRLKRGHLLAYSDFGHQASTTIGLGHHQPANGITTPGYETARPAPI